jgi:hypothetical protein
MERVRGCFLAVSLHHLLNLRWRDVWAVKGGDSVLAPHIRLLGKRSVERATGSARAGGDQKPSWLTPADSLKQRVGYGLGFVHHHQQRMVFVVLGVPAFSTSWVSR